MSVKVERTVSATDMPDDYLMALLEGRISFDEVHELYPGPDVTVTEVPEEDGEDDA